MNAERGPGETITVTMTADKASSVYNELLWSAHDDDTALHELFDALDSVLPEDLK